MQEQITKLENKVKELEANLSINNMPYSLKENIRNEVIKGEDSITSPTRLYTVVNGQEILLPTNPTGILVLKWRGKEYKLPYIT